MAEEFDDDGAPPSSSPWPLFVALGLAASEVGIFVGVFALAVGGLLVFAGSVAAISWEAGYVEELWTPVVGFGIVLVAVGVGLLVTYTGVDASTVRDVIVRPGAFGRVVPRALAIAVAGVVLLAVGASGRLLGSSGVGR